LIRFFLKAASAKGNIHFLASATSSASPTLKIWCTNERQKKTDENPNRVKQTKEAQKNEQKGEVSGIMQPIAAMLALLVAASLINNIMKCGGALCFGESSPNPMSMFVSSNGPPTVIPL
jgi:hypothetical protein